MSATRVPVRTAPQRLVRGVAAIVVLCATLALSGGTVDAAINTSAGCTANTGYYGQNVPIGFRITQGGADYTHMTLHSTGLIYFFGASSRIWFHTFFDQAQNNTKPTTYGYTTVDGRDALCVTWTNMGPTAAHVNDAQVLLVDRSDISAGSFDVIYNYGDLDHPMTTYVGWNSLAGGQSLPGSGVPGAFTAGGPHDLTGKQITFGVHGGVSTPIVIADVNTITFDTPASASYGDPDRELTATADSGLDVSLVASGNCTLTGTTLAFGDPGTCTVTASQAGGGTYGAAEDVVRVIEIARAAQVLTVTNVIGARVNGTPVPIEATSDSGLDVTIVASGACALVGDQLGFPTVGTCTLALHQAGDANHAETTTDVTFAVSKAIAALDVTGFDQAYDGTSRPVTVATDPSGLDGVTVTYDGTATAPTEAGTYAVSVTLTNDTWEAAPVNGSLVIGTADQTITVTAPDTATFGDEPVTYTATASSGLAVTATTTGPCTLTGDHLSIDGAGTCTITADQAGDDNHGAAPSDVHVLTIARAAQTLTITGDGDLTYGAGPGTIHAGSSSGLTVDVAASGPCTLVDGVLTATGAGTCTVTATQGGTTDYEPAAPVRFTVTISQAGQAGQAGQAITVIAPASLAYGAPPAAISATATSGLPVTLTPTGACSIADDKVVATGVGTCTITATQAGDANHAAANPVTVTVEMSAGQATIRLVELVQVEGEVTGVEVITDPPGLALPVTVTYDAIDPAGRARSTGTTTVPSEPGTYRVVAAVDSDLWDVETVTATFEILAARAVPNTPATPQAPQPPAPTPGPVPVRPTALQAAPAARQATPARGAGVHRSPATALPETGTGVVAFAGVGVLLVAAGASLRRAGTRRPS